MARNKLNQLQVQNQKKPGLYGDGEGLYLKVTPTGTKSWVYRYGINGKKTKMGLGAFPDISLADVRVKADQCRKVKGEGGDPKTHRDTVKRQIKTDIAKAKTFKECAEACIEQQKPSWKNPKHAQQWWNTLDTYAFPVIGDLDVATIDTPLVLEVLNPIWHGKTETAKRVRERIEAVINYAKVAGYIEKDMRVNPAQWKGHLSLALVKPSRIQKHKPHSSLPYKDIGEFMLTLRNQLSLSAKALEFLILTGGRTGEVLESVWDEIEEGVWTIPGDRMKGGVQHRVPLSKSAMAVLEYMKPVQNSDYIFPGRAPKRPMSNMTLLKLMDRMDIPKDVAVPHGFRSTFRTWAADTTAYAHEVTEKALAHSDSKLVETYRRTDFLDIRRQLMAEWADYCGKAFKNPDVVSIHAKH